MLLAHPDKHVVEEARKHVALRTVALPAVFTVEESLARRERTRYGADNVFKHIWSHRGDVEAALARRRHVVEGTYHTGAQEQLYIEPQA